MGKKQFRKTNDIVFEKRRVFEKEKNCPLIVSSCGYVKCGPMYYIDNPILSTYSFEYIIKGSGTLRINNKTYFPKTGDSYIIPANVNQASYTNPNDPWEKIWVAFSGETIEKLFKIYNLGECSYYDNLSLREYLDEIIEIANSEKSKIEIMSESSIILMKMIQKIYMFNISNLTISDSMDIADKLKIIIDNTWKADAVLNDIASKVYCSRNHAINVFKEKFGITPYKYLQQIRLNNAKALLKSKDISITDVAISLRFCDSKYFSNWFKKETGLSPREYRNSVIINEEDSEEEN